jgi:hypothetical protein
MAGEPSHVKQLSLNHECKIGLKRSVCYVTFSPDTHQWPCEVEWGWGYHLLRGRWGGGYHLRGGGGGGYSFQEYQIK